VPGGWLFGQRRRATSNDQGSVFVSEDGPALGFLQVQVVGSGVCRRAWWSLSAISAASSAWNLRMMADNRKVSENAALPSRNLARGPNLMGLQAGAASTILAFATRLGQSSCIPICFCGFFTILCAQAQVWVGNSDVDALRIVRCASTMVRRQCDWPSGPLSAGFEPEPWAILPLRGLACDGILPQDPK
jgi:hypothetical protein